MAFIDTHTHLYGEEFKDDLDEAVERARQAGALRLFLPAIDEATTYEVVAVSRRHPDLCRPMIGLHPEEVRPGYREQLDRMELLLQAPHPFIAIGEVGLDFYWDTTYQAEQLDAFGIQTEWARRYQLPLMIHARNAHAFLIHILQQHGAAELSGVFHCFTGTADEAGELLELFPRFALGIGGVVTFKKSQLPAALAAVPLGRIVLETDAPYMAPVPHRGKRNEPAFIPHIAGRLAEIHGVTPDEVCRVTTETALRLFPLAD